MCTLSTCKRSPFDIVTSDQKLKPNGELFAHNNNSNNSNNNNSNNNNINKKLKMLISLNQVLRVSEKDLPWIFLRRCSQECLIWLDHPMLRNTRSYFHTKTETMIANKQPSILLLLLLLLLSSLSLSLTLVLLLLRKKVSYKLIP